MELGYLSTDSDGNSTVLQRTMNNTTIVAHMHKICPYSLASLAEMIDRSVYVLGVCAHVDSSLT